MKSLNTREDKSSQSFLIEDTWKRLADSSRLEVETAKNFILKHSVPLFKNLGVRSPEISEYIHKLNSLDFKEAGLSSRTHVSKKGYQALSRSYESILDEIKRIKDKISDLIEFNPNLQNSILESVRKKIGEGQYGYHKSNVPFEIFQNADDAIKELEYYSGSIPSERKFFVLN